MSTTRSMIRANTNTNKNEDHMDVTETARRQMIDAGVPEAECAKAEKRYTTAELQAEFTVLGFMAPLVVVSRKSDNKRGTMMFTHDPRFYYNFEEA